MSELDAEWKQLLAEAERRAQLAGRGDVKDYLALRQINDEARRTGTEWLLQTFIRLAGEANRNRAAGVIIERDEAYRFQVGNATMVGTQLTFRSGGVRALRIAAGWPRAPGDGIVRGGGLAARRLITSALRKTQNSSCLNAPKSETNWAGSSLLKRGKRAAPFLKRARNATSQCCSRETKTHALRCARTFWNAPVPSLKSFSASSKENPALNRSPPLTFLAAWMLLLLKLRNTSLFPFSRFEFD